MQAAPLMSMSPGSDVSRPSSGGTAMILGASEARSYCRCLGLSFARQASFEQPFIQPTPRHESQQESLQDVWKPRVPPSGASPGPVRAWTALLAWNIMAVANISCEFRNSGKEKRANREANHVRQDLRILKFVHRVPQDWNDPSEVLSEESWPGSVPVMPSATMSPPPQPNLPGLLLGVLSSQLLSFDSYHIRTPSASTNGSPASGRLALGIPEARLHTCGACSRRTALPQYDYSCRIRVSPPLFAVENILAEEFRFKGHAQICPRRMCRLFRVQDRLPAPRRVSFHSFLGQDPLRISQRQFCIQDSWLASASCSCTLDFVQDS